MRSLRIIFNLVIRIDLIKQNLYPFHKYKISKHRGKRIKHPLTIAEIAFFKNVDCEEDIQYSNTKNYFLFSFYTRGINFTAIIRLRWSEIINQRVTYARAKTQGNFSLKILPPFREVLNDYNKNRRDTNYVFPMLLQDVLIPIQIENCKQKIPGHHNKLP